MLWRVRVLIRGSALMGPVEVIAYGTFVTTIPGGSVVLYLGATPFSYSEDFAWSIPLTVASLFALLGVIEHAPWGRVVASGVLILCATLNRSPPGWACCHRFVPDRDLVGADSGVYPIGAGSSRGMRSV
jgi:hypothetical protein